MAKLALLLLQAASRTFVAHADGPAITSRKAFLYFEQPTSVNIVSKLHSRRVEPTESSIGHSDTRLPWPLLRAACSSVRSSALVIVAWAAHWF